MSKMHTVYAPYDGSELGQVPMAGIDEIQQALSTADQCFRDKTGWLPVHRRVVILERAAELMSERQEQLAVQAASEGGKPLIDSRVEAARAIDGIKLCIEVIRTEQGHVIPMGGTAASAGRIAFTQREPRGIVVAVSAFNHPLNLIVHQVATAIAAGCPVLVKPAADTALSGKAFVDLLHEAGVPVEWCQFVLPENNELTQAMVTDPRVAFFSFIGSARVGWMLRSKLAPGTRCGLEHGGVAPLFISADANLDAAVAAVSKGGFYHAGQVCVSVQRVFVERSIANAFAQALAVSAKQLVVGDPTNDKTEVGPLIREAEVARVDEWVQQAVAGGGQLLCGGHSLDHQCYTPTVIFNPPVDVKVSTSEVFGPVVCVYPYDDLEQAITQANDLPFAFQAAVFTSNLHIAEQVYRGVNASAVMVNDHTAFRVDGMPFAGLGQSGHGVGGMPFSIEEMQVEKMLVWNTNIKSA